MRYVYLKNHKKVKSAKLIFFSSLALVIGTLTFLWSFYPIIAFNISNLIVSKKNLSPLPRSVMAAPLQKGLAIYDNGIAPYYSSYLKDFTKVADWFPKSSQSLSGKTNIKNYTISIPALGLTNSNVEVGGKDLAKSLVQYGNNILPGEIGNAVILGHSTLPQLYNEGDYKSIFTFLPTLERGEKIAVNINGFTYYYLVYDMFVVDPEEVWVLDEKADEALLTLITCVPPGTYWKRLIIKARLMGI